VVKNAKSKKPCDCIPDYCLNKLRFAPGCKWNRNDVDESREEEESRLDSIVDIDKDGEIKYGP
jgi:hypothetical protein